MALDTNTRILVADDHAVLRAGLRAVINAQSDMEVVAEAERGDEAERLAVALQPDLAIVDITMPPRNGVDTINSIRESCPNTVVLVLTMHDDQAFVRAALTAGAAGYLVKRAASTELLQAIRKVRQGQSYIDVSMSSQGLQQIVADVEVEEVPIDVLSNRERQVLELVALGHTNQSIADILSLSRKTVETYRGRVFEKLGFATRVDLVRYALAAGLLHTEGKG